MSQFQHPTSKAQRGTVMLRIVPITLLSMALLLPMLAGCEKVPTFQEITGQAKEGGDGTTTKTVNPPANPTKQTQNSSTPPSAAKQQAKPEEVIAKFQAMQSAQIKNGDLRELSELPSGLEAITEIDLNGSKVNENGMMHLNKFPSVASLKLAGTTFKPEGLESVSKMPALRHLVLTAARFDQSGMEHLRGLTNLESLDVAQTRVGDADVAAISGCVQLKTLNMNQTMITDASFEHLTEMRQLETLHVRGNKITGEGFMRLKALPLKDVDVSNTQFGIAGFKHIKAFTSLEKFQAGSASVTDLSLRGFSGMPNLRSLSLGQNQISDAAFGKRNMTGFQQLEELILRATKITDNSFNTIQSYKQLKKLNVEGTGVSKGAAQLLKQKTPGIEEIKFTGGKI